MKHKTLNAALAALLCIFSAGGAQAQCGPTAGVASVGIGTIEQPFPYADLRPALTAQQIAALPALPDPEEEEIPVREQVYISTALASLLQIPAIDPDWRHPNPQIRVRITNPASFSNWDEGATFRSRKSAAVFTIAGIIQDSRRVVWVYDGYDAGGDVISDSGHYKLLAEDTFEEDPVTLDRDRLRQIDNIVDGNADGLLDNVTATVYCTPVSSATITRNGVTSTTNYYSEPDSNGSYKEVAINKNDNRFALIVPHGQNIETKTSDQIAPFTTVLEGSPYTVNTNLWEVRGRWDDDQTSKRWHITSTALHSSSFPGLQAMLNQTQFDALNGWAFRRTLSFHGFSADEADVIVGGGTDLNAKCLVARRIKEESGMGPVAVRIFHDDEIIDVAATGGRTVCRKGLDGDSANNIINRLAAEGGLQIEQSGDVRSTTTYRDGVAKGAAKAMGELLTTTVPTNVCSIYAAPIPEDDVPDC